MMIDISNDLKWDTKCCYGCSIANQEGIQDKDAIVTYVR